MTAQHQQHDQRLANIRRLLHEVTSDAFASTVSNRATILGHDALPQHDDIAALDSEDDAANDRAGYETGLALFGTSSSYREQMERELEERLNAVEKEAQEIRRASLVVQEQDEDPVESAPIPALSESIEDVQQHVELLQKCLEVRRWLEEVDALSLLFDRGVSSSSALLSSSSFSPSNLLFSPSSLSSFRFDTHESTANEPSPMARAATLIRRIQDEMDVILQTWHERAQRNGNGEEMPKDDSSPMIRMQSEIIEELTQQTRRKKMELRYRATFYLEKCWEAAEGRKLIVRGSHAPSDPHDCTPREAHGARPQSNPSPLSDAYAVLEAFHDERFPVFGETLDRAMETVGSQLFTQVFRPCLTELDSTLSLGSGPVVVGYYRWKRETLQGTRGGVGRKYDVTIKGPTVQLEWELCKMNAESMTFVDNEDDREDATAMIAVASEMDETQLAASAPTASVATFLSSLHFLTQIFEFVHCHLLQSRTDLASLVGKYLLGTYPVPTSLVAGSAKLGGMLVGCAAWGEETGETRPLMVQLIRLMRKWCIPTESTPEVWRLIPRIQRVLRREVDAFERKMVGLGFMTDGEVVKETSAASLVGTSSPMGLSVLVNEEDVASPMNPNLTWNQHCSPIEIVSPSAERNMTSNAVRSSLSEIAHAFLQVYSENQRSQILNQGRSVLLNTDYHNSVQVGTFIPPPAEPGTLEHLDDDPLNAFLFPQCSISTTAQKILQLCRNTLDEATRPEMAKELDALPPMLYRASRELLDLFRAMIPTLYASEIGSIPRMAAILHNDCVFLAHEASLLGAEYKRKFRSDKEDSQSKTHLLSEICTFVDMVPPFRDLATKSMGSMLELQKNQLLELISSRLDSFEQALSSNESVMEWDDAETALRAALYHLRHLAQSWSQVLARDVYHLAIGNLVDTIFTLLLDPVLSAEAITDAASRFVHSLFLDAVRGAAEVFLVGESTTIHPITNPTETSQQIKIAVKYSMLFAKFQCVGQFMAMRLDDISRGLEEGVFRSVTAKELSHLVTAAYDESAKRNALLKILALK